MSNQHSTMNTKKNGKLIKCLQEIEFPAYFRADDVQ